MLKITTFGSVQFTLDNQPLTALKTRKVQALLIYLAYHAGKPFAREHLQGLLWGSSPKQRAANSLRQALAILRRHLPPNAIQQEGMTITFAADASYWLDATAVLQEPDHYEGPFLNGFIIADAPLWERWLQQQQTYHQQTVIAHWQALAEEQRLTDPTTAVFYFKKILQIEPWQEPIHQQLIYLYDEMGNHAAAIRQYQACQQALQQELGVPPSPQTQTLYQRLQARTPLLIHNLPAPSSHTPLVGRGEECATLANLLSQNRFITIVGLGGIGKTRLAFAVAHQQRTHFSDGTFWVDLVDATPNQLPQRIANAISYKLAPNQAPESQLIAHLATSQMLLLLDNFDTLATAQPARTFVQKLLTQTSYLHILITSRERLNLRLETIYPLAGLSLEATEQPATAVQLFLQHAQRVNPHYQSDGLAPIERLCHMMEGMPLGIELAAAWVRLFDVDTLAAKIEQNLTFLQATHHDVPARQQSLTAVFNYSWAQLNSNEQRLIRALSLFQPGFDHDAITTITRAIPTTLLALLDKSLLQTMANNRYRLHERLRQFVREQWLDQEAQTAVLRQHATYYNQWLAQQQADAKGGERQHLVLDEIDANRDNIRLAWEWAIKHQVIELLQQALPALNSYHVVRGYFHDEAATLRSALTMLDSLPTEQLTVAAYQLKQHLLILSGTANNRLGHMDKAETNLLQALALAEKANVPANHALNLAHLGSLYSKTARYTEARDYLHQALAIYSQIDEFTSEFATRNVLGRIYQITGEWDKARVTYEQCLADAQREKYYRGEAYILNNLGVTANGTGNPTLAKEYYLKAVPLLEMLQERRMLAITYNNLGNIALNNEDNNSEAKMWYQKGLTAVADTGEKWARALLLLNLGDCITDQGDWVEAEHYLQQSYALFHDIKDYNYAASVQTALGRLALDQQQLSLMQIHLCQALQLAHNNPIPKLEALTEWGVLALHQEKFEQAAQYLHLVGQHPATEDKYKKRAATYFQMLPLSIREAALQTASADAHLLDTVVASLQTLCQTNTDIQRNHG